MLFIYFSPCKFAKFFMSFLKAQVSFPSNFASIYIAIKHDFSVLFLAQTYTLVKGTNYRVIDFFDFWVFGSKFVKFLMSIVKLRVIFNSNFALFFIVMTHNSSINFKVINFLLYTKGSRAKSQYWHFQVLVKICQISHVIFQTTSQCFLKF